jgi:myo-inositol-1(or 4)-monophosphatase
VVDVAAVPSSTELLDIADDAARAAGALLRDGFGGPSSGVRSKSTPTDLVSEADLAAERTMRERISARRPHDAVLGEEAGELPGDHPAGGEGALRWVIDPLDGTVNFLFGIPHWCVSAACEDSWGTLVGVVHDPLRDETFAAARDARPTLNGEPVSASGSADVSTALVATGFSYDAGVRGRQAEVAGGLLPRVRDVRRLGSAALDLAWTACGRYDAYYERDVKPWDIGAGALLCARAGLEVRTLRAQPPLPGGVLAAPAAIVDELCALVGP